ncbi:hypothetical protein M885DRAFT_624581 [Pelagophyceae sp. CCMP2097]|nr:hypothetical protein M885DRAFT_624581 [Pelagophyceae sp. CCMP2097]
MVKRDLSKGRRLAFGFICGSVTGLTIGGVDGYKAFRLKAPPTSAGVVGLFANEMARSGIIFSAFFSVYQLAKFGLDYAQPEETTSICTATVIALAPLSVIQPLRRCLPFAATLIAVDAYHSMTRR